MTWLFFVLITPLFAATINYIDKYLIESYAKEFGIGTLVIFSGSIGLPAAIIIGVLQPGVLNLNPQQILLLILSGFMYVGFFVPYLYAMEKADASVVAPLFLLTSIIGYFLGYAFLGETLTNYQLIGSTLVIVGSLALTLEQSETTSRFKYKLNTSVLLLMLASSTMAALNGLIFKFYGLDLGFWVVSFWEYVGFVILTVLFLLFVTSYRNQFFKAVKANSKRILSLNFTNEILAITAKTTFNMALLTGPIALTFVVSEGFQPLFVLVIGLLLTKFFPTLSSESFEKDIFIKKLLSIFVMVLGTVIIYLA